MSRDQEILQFWFGSIDDETEIAPDSPRLKRWFRGGEEMDREVRQLFGRDTVKAQEGLYKSWENKPQSRLALIILLDQFPRHIYRDTPKSFATDEQALELSLRSIADGTNHELLLIHQVFLFMPLMHSEDLEVQNKSLQQYRKLTELAKLQKSLNEDYYFYTLEYALKHHALIQKYGRFPHRNEIFGRKSTPEEIEYLKNPEPF